MKGSSTTEYQRKGHKINKRKRIAEGKRKKNEKRGLKETLTVTVTGQTFSSPFL